MHAPVGLRYLNSMSLSLGPFTLLEPIGQGADGIVWRAEARGPQAVEVAVKVLDLSRRDERFLELFKREVRAMAALDHPGIVDIYDYGRVSEEEAAASDGDLVPASPFVAMSWADRGTLGRVGGLEGPADAFDWRALQDALLQVLDALGHAHARGVTHRDLKPDNVLAERASEGLRYRLADFGIAHADREDDAAPMAGTPFYMAPEQFRNTAEDYGPWTDLYALGCMAFELAAGVKPFRSENILSLTLEHVESEPPPLEPRLDLPERFEEWVRWLMSKPVERRPRRAADAAIALATLGPPRRPGTKRAVARPTRDATTAPARPAPAVAVPPATAALPEALPWLTPPVPPRWEAARLLRKRWLRGIGHGLVGLREHPMIGREREREAAWGVLRKVARGGQPHLLVIRGAAGMGKSRLARWLLERADELGAALGVRGSFAPGPQPGLEAVLRKLLRVGLLEGGALRRRIVERALEPVGPLRIEEATLVRRLLEGEDVDAMRLPPIVERLLRHRTTGARRPMVLWLDDVQWGYRGLVLVDHLLRCEGLPLLVVATARDDVLAEEPAAQELLEGMPALATTTLELNPLAEAEATALLEELLGLERGLVDRLAHKSGGHPLLATQLVETLAAQGLLEPDAGGYSLAADAALTIPDGLHQIWVERLARLLDGRPRDDRIGLEIAACFGLGVEVALWRAACEHAAIQPSEDLLDGLLEQRFVVAVPGSGDFRFVHGMLVESIAREASEAGRWAGHHRACAASLEPRWRRRRDPLVGAALGRHLVAGGQAQASLAPLLAGAAAQIRRGALVEAEQLLVERRAALLEVPAEVQARHEAAGALLSVRAASIRGRHEEAERRVGPLMARLTEGRPAAEARLEAAEIAERAGRRVDAHERFAEAGARFDALGDRVGRGRAAVGQGMMAAYLGSVPEAVALCERAVADLMEAGAPLWLGRAERALGNLALLREAHDEARARYRRALRSFEPLAAEHDIHKTLNGLAEAHRLAGDLSTALEAFEQLLERQRRMVPTSDLDLTRFNAGLTLIALGRFEDAATRLAEVEAGLAERPNEVLTTGLVFAWLPCLAHTGKLARLAETLVVAGEEAARAEGRMEHDDAVNAAIAGEALCGGDPTLARACYAVALTYWERHGPAARAERAAARLRELGEA